MHAIFMEIAGLIDYTKRYNQIVALFLPPVVLNTETFIESGG
jgi:hypothetical protein